MTDKLNYNVLSKLKVRKLLSFGSSGNFLVKRNGIWLAQTGMLIIPEKLCHVILKLLVTLGAGFSVMSALIHWNISGLKHFSPGVVHWLLSQEIKVIVFLYVNDIQLFQLVSHSVCHGFTTYTEWPRDITYNTRYICWEASVPEFGEPWKCSSYGRYNSLQITAWAFFRSSLLSLS
jgi:hypothetical protein